jgi:hypothetical protein
MKGNSKSLFVKKMFTGKALLPILILLVGVIVATFQIRGKSKSLVRNKGMKDRCIVQELSAWKIWRDCCFAHSFGRKLHVPHC